MTRATYLSACALLYSGVVFPGCEFPLSNWKPNPPRDPPPKPDQAKPEPEEPEERPDPVRPTQTQPPPVRPTQPQPPPVRPTQPQPPPVRPNAPPPRPEPVPPVQTAPPRPNPPTPPGQNDEFAMDGFCRFKDTEPTIAFRGDIPDVDTCRSHCQDEPACTFYAFADKEFKFGEETITTICVLYDDHPAGLDPENENRKDFDEWHFETSECYKLNRGKASYRLHIEGVCNATTPDELLLGKPGKSVDECAEECLDEVDCHFFSHSEELSFCVVHKWTECAGDDWRVLRDHVTYSLNRSRSGQRAAGASSPVLYICIAVGVVLSAIVCFVVVYVHKGKSTKRKAPSARTNEPAARSPRPRSAPRGNCRD